MLLSDFDYLLPDRLIAQKPAERRDGSRLMVLNRDSGTTSHFGFRDLPGLLSPGDLLVLNDTRVIPAHLLGRRADEGTSARVEVLLVERLEVTSRSPGREVWTAMLRNSRREGDHLSFEEGLRATVTGRDGSLHILEFSLGPGMTGNVHEVLDSAGQMPIPPYIRRTGREQDSSDRRRYQTVFAANDGAVAAPTAGLHFTEELLERLRGDGVRVEMLTLHVGPGTFQPVRVERIEDHTLPAERFVLPERVTLAVGETRARGGRVIAVGTTVTRVLESQADESGRLAPVAGECGLFIRPGYRFRVVDALVTNFHLPRSTLLMLVSAFAGREVVLSAYIEAVEKEYRFYSYGDAMFIT